VAKVLRFLLCALALSPARAAFGVYGAQPKTFIFYREVY